MANGDEPRPIAPVTLGVSQVLGACCGPDGQLENVHPGLVLDKFARSWEPTGNPKFKFSEHVQKPTVNQVVRLAAGPPPGLPFDDLVKRWERVTAKAVAFTGTTAGPLTLHLARASALENPGICLHPIYGFTYLPGSGLKGLARAFAETVWLQNETDKLAGWQRIEAVFGWAPGSNIIGHTDDGKPAPKPWMPPGAEDYRKEKHSGSDEGAQKAKPASSGSVVFHDGWPQKWPKLTIDILNSHHPKYYQEQNEPPGDWEDPVPVYFLSVPPGIPFRFAVAPRRNDVPAADVELAKQWLVGGLTVLGCGAKTATGYGHFDVDQPPPAGGAGQDATKVWGEVLEKAGRKLVRATVELVTPAFLAGANQQREDCDLRPATLRGQLRWWWRTMHAGFVDVPTLKRMEAAIWGDTKRGGAVRTVVTRIRDSAAVEFNRQQEIAKHKLPAPPNNKPTAQGLVYSSYGMDEVRQGNRFQRFLQPAGANWSVTLTARHSSLSFSATGGGETTSNIDADVVIDQAKAALWLLSHLGGVGSKSRKGFGSLKEGL